MELSRERIDQVGNHRVRAALIQERLNVLAGSEKVLFEFHKILPKADVWTSFANHELMKPHLGDAEVHTSFLQKMPLIAKHHQKFLPLYMLAFEQLPLQDYDLVISNSHCAAKAVITRPQACHICYCLSPMRYAWDMQHDYMQFQSKLVRRAWGILSNYVRVWDYATAARVDYFVACSRHVARRIRKFYGRPSAVVYPPTEIQRFYTSRTIDNYFLVVSRFAPYKRVDLIIKAFNNLGLPLIVVGTGEQEDYLKKIAGPNVQFKGHVPDAEVADYFAHCKGLVVAAEEDFGLNTVECLASGRPVVAYNAGGSPEIIQDEITGILFPKLTEDSIMAAVRQCSEQAWDSELIRESSQRFSQEVFRRDFSAFVESALDDFHKGSNEKPVRNVENVVSQTGGPVV